MDLQPIKTDRAPIPRGPYNQAIRAGDTIYVAGQIPVDPATNQLVDGDAAAQARQVFENVKAILEAAGGAVYDAQWQRLGYRQSPGWYNGDFVAVADAGIDWPGLLGGAA